MLKPGSHVDTEIDVKVVPYVQPEMRKLCQREGIFASDNHGCSLARSPPMCRGLDLLPDWDTSHIRDALNFRGGVCEQVRVVSVKKKRLITAADVAVA